MDLILGINVIYTHLKAPLSCHKHVNRHSCKQKSGPEFLDQIYFKDFCFCFKVVVIFKWVIRMLELHGSHKQNNNENGQFQIREDEAQLWKLIVSLSKKKQRFLYLSHTALGFLLMGEY